MTTVRIIDVRWPGDVSREFELIQCDPMGAKIMLPKADFKVIKVEGLKSPAANILKQEMLARGGDVAVARSVVTCTAPQSDALIMGTRKQIHDALPKLRMEPFGLKNLADQIVDLLAHEAEKSAVWRCRDRSIPLGGKTTLMGIVNVTGDSFSGDGLGLDVSGAVAQAKSMLGAGAEILDIGGESTRPGSDPVPEDEEIRRVLPVVKALAAETNAIVSIDTMKSAVAEAALGAGAHIINDVTGVSFDPKIADIAARYGAGLVIMHIKGTPKNMQVNPVYDDLVGEICAFLRTQAGAALERGVARECICVDPGIGFAKTAEHNLEVLRRLREFRSLGYPVLSGPSRKSFIGKILDVPAAERVEGTGAAVAISIANGADVVRVHDVEPIVKIVRVTDAIVRG
jgi:dihydropteroate synthase